MGNYNNWTEDAEEAYRRETVKQRWSECERRYIETVEVTAGNGKTAQKTRADEEDSPTVLNGPWVIPNPTEDL